MKVFFSFLNLIPNFEMVEYHDLHKNIKQQKLFSALIIIIDVS